MLSHSLLGVKAPEFTRLHGWINTPPLTMNGLSGKVVLLEFWTFDCENCIRTLPYMRRLSATFARDPFVLIGVHTPEFEHERDPENVAYAIKRFQIEYPVALDSDNATWKLYGNEYWPRHALIDAHGIVRWEHVGEGEYEEMEQMVRALLREIDRVPP